MAVKLHHFSEASRVSKCVGALAVITEAEKLTKSIINICVCHIRGLAAFGCATEHFPPTLLIKSDMRLHLVTIILDCDLLI